jgi:glycopeptide antibiotics resistance protein
MILLVPVFSVLNKSKFHSIKKTMLYFMFATYLTAVYLFVGMPTLQFMRFDLSLTLMPFLPMIADFKNTILNIILFIPLGIMLPFLWKKYNNLKTTLIFGFSMSLVIELLQILTYRATDINDLIANTLGAVVGYFVFRITSCVFPSLSKFAKRTNEIAVILLSVFAVMFFVQPYLATLYYRIIQ